MKLLVAATVVTLGATLAAVPATAEEAPPDPGTCTKAEIAELRAAGDNFSEACFLPGQVLAGVEGAEAEVAPGDVERRNMERIGRVPQTGPFAEDGAFGTDIAFKGDFAYGGNYNGFTVYDISRPGRPSEIRKVICPGSQNDISIYRDVLILSVDSSRNNDTCRNEPQSATEESSWEGIRVFDISRPARPRFVKSVETDCGSHTHTVAPSKKNKALFVYVSSYNPNESHPDCQPPHDKVSIVKVPARTPANARVVRTPVLFPDGGNPGAGGGNATVSARTDGCHDLTAFPQKDLMAGACMGDGILMDLSQRARPRVIDVVRDDVNFAFWHSATFTNRGDKLVFTDELGGGAAATCNPAVGSTRGANGIYDVVNREMVFRSYFKLPRTQSTTENCVAHNGSMIPVKGRNLMVQSWYQGGTSIFDFTNSSRPREVAYSDPGPISETQAVLGGTWSSYWYNGRVYSHDITKGLEVFKVNRPWAKQAEKVRLPRFNAQSQPSFNG